MAFVRHGHGPRAAVGALASQVHPVFMLPPLAVAAFGAVLAGRFSPLPGALQLAAVFLGVYTAHVKDGYVDFYGRGEDDDHPLSARGCRRLLAATVVGFLAVTAALAVVVDATAALLVLPGLAIGYLHAPQLDTTPVTATMGYPAGIALALLGGYYVQAGTLTPRVLAIAAVFLVALSGVKVVDDAKDVQFDRSIGKRTVAVAIGPEPARAGANWLFGAALFAVLALAVEGVLPPSATLGAGAFGLVAVVATRAPPRLATMLLVRGSYVFLAGLVAAVWFHPLAGRALPDLSVLGPYTYLVSEAGFGVVALGLLHRANAWRAAAVTVALVYPVGYLWDWYSLSVGIFAIPLRTGVTLLGIPLEEHLFLLVVPAFVIGVHELRRASTDG